MPKTAIIIPARNETYLTQTIEDIFENATGDIVVTAVIDGGSWPIGWAETVERFKPRLLTIHHGASRGMRASINAAVDARNDCDFIIKSDAHCSFASGFDTVLTGACEDREVLVPRRFRLDAENWRILNDGRPPVDYEYLTYPDGEHGGLKGKIWAERTKERADIQIDETPLFQGSCWCMRRDHFQFLDLMDEEHYGTFWKEALEIGFKVWLSGGRVRVHKGTSFSHLHKSRRGYNLDSTDHAKAAEFSRRWLSDCAGWPKQTLPFTSLIKRFWPLPGWPEDWETQIKLL